MKRRILCAVLALTMLCTLALSGCETSIGERRQDKSETLYVGVVGTSFPTSFMPWLSRDGIAPTVASMLYNTLFSYNDETDDFEPLLARRWCYVDLEGDPLTEDGTYDTPNDYDAVEAYYVSRAEDYMAVRVELFDNICWSDGEPVTAEDVYYSFDVATDNAFSNHAGALAWTADLRHSSSRGELIEQGIFTAQHPDLSGTYPIRADEEKTVLYLHVNKVFGAVTTLFNTILILPQHIWKPLVSEQEQLNNKHPAGEFLRQFQNPVGCGAWTLNTAETNSQMIVLDRNPRYHLRAADGSELYKAKQIRFLLYLDSNTAIFAVRKGYIDILDSSVSTNFVSLLEKEPDICVSRAAGTFTSCLVLNVNPSAPFNSGMKTLFADRDFRKAIALAINRQELVDKVLDGAGKTAGAGLILPNNALLYNEKADILSAPMDIRRKEANEILDRLYPQKDKDGYRLIGGERIRFEILAGAGAQDLVSYLQRQMQTIGIEIAFKAAGSAPETTYLYRSDFDMTVQPVILSMANADVMYRAHFVTTERSSNYGKYADPHLTETIEQMRMSLNRERKAAYIRTLQEMVAQSFYKIPLYSADVLSVARTDRVTGYKTMPGAGVFNNETLKNLHWVNA